jgi:hypothetical protein
VIKTKICTKCNTELSAIEDNFNNAKFGKYGLESQCKSCKKIYKEKYKLRNQNFILDKNVLKKCTCCGKEYPGTLKYFNKNGNSKNGLNAKCKICKREQDRVYGKNNRNKISAYKLEKYKNDINYKLTDNLRGRIWGALKGKYKSKSTIELLGCSIEELKLYLKSKFQPGMTFDNYSYYGWHIDHIRPCCSFDLTKKEEQEKCFNYTNLQPLWGFDNMSKGGKYEF